MGELLSYSIVSGMFLLSMYVAFKIFLSGENQHAYNRKVLLLIYVMSFTALPITSLVQRLLPSRPNHNVISELTIVNGPLVGVDSHHTWSIVLLWLFVIGMLVVALRTLVIWWRLISLIRCGEKINHEGYTIVLTDNSRFAPFSWIKYIVISRSDYEKYQSAIVAHEIQHIACHHWVDLLIAQGVCVINWFNPAAWLMRKELMLVHEYQADMAVMDSGYDIREYQMLLIKKAVGARFPSLANSLNHSKLKKRITMMYKEKSGAGRKLKALALVPMFALALSVASVPSVQAAISTISSSEISVSKGSENLPHDENIIQVYKVSKITSDGNETTVVINGKNVGNSVSVSGGTFTTMGKTYNAKSLQCNLTDGDSKITATFPFSSKFENASMTLIINGEEIPFNLEKFFNNARAVVYSAPDSTSTKSIIITDNESSSSIKDLEVYLDGKKIDYDDMKNISSDNIASITVDKNSGRIIIVKKNK